MKMNIELDLLNDNILFIRDTDGSIQDTISFRTYRGCNVVSLEGVNFLIVISDDDELFEEGVVFVWVVGEGGG